MAGIDVTKIIDREAEAEIFAGMLRCDTPRRVLVVSDKNGMGKSVLLRRLRYLCDYIHDIPVALIPFEEFTSRPDLFAIIRPLRKDLSAGGVAFPIFDDLNLARTFRDTARFSERLRSVQGAVDLRGARVSGPARVAGTLFDIGRAENVNVTPPPWDEEAESTARARCIEVFLGDLMTCSQERPVVLLFDTVEQASEELRRWLFLELVHKRVLLDWKRHKLIVVLAGQGVAELLEGRLRPEHRECIEPIASLSSWGLLHVDQFLKVHGFNTLDQTQIAFIHRALGEGHTLTYALALAKVLVSEETA